MGRAMIIIVSGLLVSIGITQSGLSDKIQQMVQISASYAESTEAYNLAHAGLELTIEDFMDDEDNCSTGSSDTYQLTQGEVTVTHLYCADPTDDDDTLFRLQSLATAGNAQHSISVSYSREPLHFVPFFEGAIGILDPLFTFSIDGSSAYITGEEASGTCPNGPGISVLSDSDSTLVATYDDQIGGSPNIEVNPDMSFDEAAELIERLEGKPGITYLSGNINDNLGTEDNPGVFFVESPTKLTGGASDGYGILVVRTNGELEYEGEIDLGGNFTFNGLVIFENAYSLSAKGTPSVNGSILIGKTNEIGTIDVDVRGNVDISYDCSAHELAKKASANALNIGNRFNIVSVFE